MIGKQIGNYKIEEKVGEGGMGVVYKAIDLDLDRPVAIKVLSADLSGDPALLERFRGEAKAQAHLNHANIASLYTLLNIEGHTSIVMEYLEGETLDQILRRRGLIPWEEAVPWFKQALLGIGFAHRRGIVHRDIKPSNIMVNRYGVVKVMDFGIAKVLGGQRLTKTGTNVGTVAYMSPEQVRNRPVDVRTDIYSLGVTLYELLTAHLPFESDSDFQVMSDHVNTPPPAPVRHYPYIPKGIEQCVLKALEKDPDQRFQSVEEFGAALEHPQGLDGGAAGQSVPTIAAPGGAKPSASGAAAPMRGEIPIPQTPGNLPRNAPAADSAPAPASQLAARPKDKKIVVGVGVVVLAMLAFLGYTTLRPKPAAAVSGARGGGGQLAGSSGLASQLQPGSVPSSSKIGAASDQSAVLTSAASEKPSDSSDPSILNSLGTGGGTRNTKGTERLDSKVPSTGSRASQKLPVASRRAPEAPVAPSGSSGAKQDSSDAPVPAQPAVVAPPAGPSAAELNNAGEDLMKIRARMDAVNQSLSNLKQQQAAQGLGLRGDIVASESRMYSYFQMAERSLQDRNLESAQKNMDRAEQELSKLEHFLGR